MISLKNLTLDAVALNIGRYSEKSLSMLPKELLRPLIKRIKDKDFVLKNLSKLVTEITFFHNDIPCRTFSNLNKLKVYGWPSISTNFPLKSLKICFNETKPVPQIPSFGFLKQLIRIKKFTLKNSSLTVMESSALFEELCQITTLKSLSVTQTSIHNVPRLTQLHELKLKKIIINIYELKQISELLQASTNLNSLDLSESKFKQIDIQELFTDISASASLRKFVWNDPALIFLEPFFINDEIVAACIQALLSNKNIKHLSLKAVFFYKEGFNHLLKNFSKPCEVKSLNIANNGLELGAVSEFCTLLKKNIHLECLDISWIQAFETRSCLPLLNALKEALLFNTTLKNLSLNYCATFGEGCGQALQEILTKNTVLTNLSLQGNQLRSDQANHIIPVLTGNRSLTCLNLASNNLGVSIQIELIFTAVLHSALKLLDLSGNERNQDLVYFASTLTKRRAIKILI
jgi:hypothetical protein